MEPLLKQLPVTTWGRSEIESDLVWLDCVRRVILADTGREDSPAANLDPVAMRERLRLELRAVEEQIARTKSCIACSVVLPDDDPRVAVGCTVTVADECDEKTWLIGGLVTAATGAGRLSYESPLVRALLGREAGDEVEFVDPSGPRRARVVSIRRVMDRKSPSSRR